MPFDQMPNGLTINPPMKPGFRVDRELLSQLADKLLEQADVLIRTDERASALIELNVQIAAEVDLQRFVETFAHSLRQIIGARFSIEAAPNVERNQCEYSIAGGGDGCQLQIRFGATNLGRGVYLHARIKAQQPC
jgi:hypothetical protein